MYKIEFQDNFFVVTDITTGIEEIREVRNQVKWRLSGSVYSFYYNIANLVDQNSPNIIRLGENAKEFDFSEIVDGSEVPFASRAILNSLLNQKLGFILQLTETTWGLITGNIADQTDLQLVLNEKFDVPTGDTTQYIAGDGTLITFPVAGQAGSLVRQVRNVSGATMTKGTVVYINGANGNKPTIAKALATSDATSARTFGLLQSDIPNNTNGYVVVIGDLVGLDTSAISEGTQLYLSSTTAGEYTTIKQVAPAHMVYVGKVTRSHPTLGQIEVYVQNGFELDELHDVLITSVADGQVLQFEGASGLWKNKTLATGITIGSTAVSSGADTNVLFQNGGVVQESSSFTYNNGLKIISTGTLSTNLPLQIRNFANTKDVFAVRGDDYSVFGGNIFVNTGANASIIELYSAFSGATELTLQSSSGDAIINGRQALTFRINGTNQMKLYSSANLMLGQNQADTGYKLQVNGNIRCFPRGSLSTDLALNVRNFANTADLFNVQGDGNVGIGSSNTGENKVYLYSNLSNTTNTTSALLSVFAPTFTAVSSYKYAIRGDLNIANQGTIGGLGSAGVLGRLQFTGTNTYSYGFGHEWCGVKAEVFMQANNTANRLAGMYIAGQTAGGVIGDFYRLLIQDATVGTITNDYGIFQASGVKNYFAGNMGIGTTNPTARVHITAQGALSTDIAFKVRNSTDTTDWFKIDGTGAIVLSNSLGVGVPILTFGKIHAGSGYFYADASSYLTWSTQLKIDGTLLLQNGINMQGYGKNISMNYGTMTGGSSMSMVGPASISLRPDFNLATVENSTSLFIAPNSTANPTKKLIKLMDSTLTNTFFAVNGNGQTSIGTNAPNASAKVQIDSTTQGFLPPRMTNAERTAIASPAVGLMVYCTDATEGLYVYKSTGWTFVI